MYIYILKLTKMMTEFKNEDYRVSATANLKTMTTTKYVYVYSKLTEMMTEFKNEDYRVSATANLKSMIVRRITITIENELNNL